MLWGDPARADQESRLDAFGFGPSQRGGSISNFGTKAIDDFLQRSGACMRVCEQANVSLRRALCASPV